MQDGAVPENPGTAPPFASPGGSTAGGLFYCYATKTENAGGRVERTSGKRKSEKRNRENKTGETRGKESGYRKSGTEEK